MSFRTPSAGSSRHHHSLGGQHSRREFLRRGALVAGAGLATPWALDLSGLASAAGSSDPDDYRALVCLFMFGGNDAYDTFIPNDAASYQTYATARGAIARDADSIVGIDPIDGFSGAGTFGFAPELSELKTLFDSGDAAVISNVGTLIRPFAKAEWSNESNRPPQLFSHNDQQSFWQASSPEGATTGWGGRISDLALDDNGANSSFTSISVAGNAVLMNGRDAFQYQVSPSGVTQLDAGTYRYDVQPGIREVMELADAGMYGSSYVSLSRRALGAAEELSSAVDAANAQYDFSPYFDVTSPNVALARTAAQLRMVAQLIAAGRNTLGLKRQVFFVAMGGFDNHSGLVADHRPLLSAIDGSLAGFHDAMRTIDAHNDVTSFTASDFGRTLASNGDGSDHGWGAHHIVVGGSVAGKRIYGDVPEVADDGPDDVGRGRLLPAIAVDQYASTLARWMGAESSDLPEILPNINNFDTDDLGFMAAAEPPTTTTTTTTTPKSPDADGIDEPATALQPATRIGQS